MAGLSYHFPRFGATALVRRAAGAAVGADDTRGFAASLRRRLGDGSRLTLAPDALFPANVLGHWYVWDTASDEYVLDESIPGAPLTGFRIRLYSVNPATFMPVEPLQTLGYVELTDESTTGADRIRVKLVLGTSTIANYLITAVEGTDFLDLDAVGYIVGGDGTNRVDFDLSNYFTATTGDLVYQLDAADGSEIRVELHGTEESATVLFRIHKGRNTIELSGDATLETVDLEVRYNGTVVATITGPKSDPTFTTAGGRTMTDAEKLHLLAIFAAADQIIEDFLDPIMRPAEVVFRR
jgi:hypothetical protein